MSRIEEFEAKLTEFNYKLTTPRRLIMELLVEYEEEHLTAEEIHNRLREKGYQVGLATVYRTLELFCELGILSRLNFDDTCRHYELEEKGQHHHHLICTHCNRITEFSDELLEEFMGEIEKQYGFKVTDHIIKYMGYCSQCWKEISENEEG